MNGAIMLLSNPPATMPQTSSMQHSLAALAKLYERHATLDALLQAAVQIAAEILAVEYCGIAWADEDKANFRVRASFSEHGVNGHAEHANHLIASLIQMNGHHARANHGNGISDELPEYSYKENALAVPLRVNAKLVGYLFAAHGEKTGRFYTTADASLLATLGEHVGLAIEMQSMRQMLASNYMAKTLGRNKKNGASEQSRPISHILAAVEHPEEVAKLLARTFYKDLRKAGFETNQILMAATELIDNLNHALQKTRAKSETPTLHDSRNLTIQKSKNPIIHKSTNPSIQQSNNPLIHQSNNPIIHQSTYPSIRNSFKVAHIATIALSLRHLLLNQMRSIQQAGFEVCGISAPGPEVTVIEAAGVRHFPVAMTRNFTPFADLKALWQIYRLLKRERFTIVHTHTPKPGLLGQLAARLAGVPVVVNTIHGFYFHDKMPARWRRFYILLEKIAARCSDFILSQNREDIETAVRERICHLEDIAHLGNGIDVVRFDRGRMNPDLLQQKRRELGLPHDALVVGFVGRLVAEKGIIELFQAARLVKQRLPNVRFLFAGAFDEVKADGVKPEIAREHGVSDICIFAGWRQDMPEMYALMDVFVLPSHREGFPRSPMEASAMEVPCVVTDIRGCREAVEHDRNGVLIPLGDVQALSNTVLELLNDSAKARRLAQEGRRMALARFDERLIFEKVKAEYGRLLKAKGLLPQTMSTDFNGDVHASFPLSSFRQTAV